MSDAQLTPVLEYHTDVPAPVAVPHAEGGLSFEADLESTVLLKVSSEFTTHIAPTVPFGGKSSKLGLFQDSMGQPIMFSIGTDDHLYCLKRTNGGSEAWTSYDITPDKSERAVTFDIQNTTSKVTLAVALEGTEGSHVYSCVCDKGFFESSGEDSDQALIIPWVYRSIAKVDQARNVISLSSGGGSAQANSFIIAGTKSADSTVATFYTINTDVATTDAWPISVLPNNATRVIDVAPALHQILGEGTYALYEVDGGPTRCAFSSNNSATARDLETSALGDLRSLFSTTTPWNHACTDLFLATEHGIAYFSHLRDIQAPPMVILPDISFAQVVAAEYQLKIVVFAVSDTGELYYVEGTRGVTITFKASGYPIRGGIRCLSAQYNTAASSTELMYIANSAETQIKHLWRDPSSFGWSDAVVAVKPMAGATQKTTSHPAYVTTITIASKATGYSVGADYPCLLSSDWVQVTVNDNAYTLTHAPITVKTDGLGRINIVQLADLSLSSSPYALHLSLFGQASIEVQPTQRVMTQMARYDTVEKLQKARSTDGRPITFKADMTQLADTAQILAQVSPMVGMVDPEAGKKIVPGVKEVAPEFKGTDDKNWFESALEFVGDAWETIKYGLKKAFSFTVKVVGGVIRVVLKIALKVINFVVSSVGSLLKVVSGVLRDTLGITALDDFMDWLGYNFDWDKVKETQQHIVTFANATLTSVVDSFMLLRPIIVGYLDAARDSLASVIKDKREAPERKKDCNPLGFLSWLLDNPIINLLVKYSPVHWLMTQVGEIIEDEIKFPNLSPILKILRDAVGEFLMEQAQNLSNLGADFIKKLKDFASGSSGFLSTLGAVLGDAIWTCYDFVRSLILKVFDVIGPIVVALKDVLNFEMKFPIVSDLWDVLTDGVPLTMMNLFTLFPALCLTLYSAVIYKKPPFSEGAIGDLGKYVLTKSLMEKSVTRLSVSPPAGISMATSATKTTEATGSLLGKIHAGGGISLVKAENVQTMAVVKMSVTPEEKELIRVCEVGQVWSGLAASICGTARTAIEVVMFRKMGVNKKAEDMQHYAGDHHFHLLHHLTTFLDLLAAIAAAVETGYSAHNPRLQVVCIPALKITGTVLQFVTVNLRTHPTEQVGPAVSLCSVVSVACRSFMPGIGELVNNGASAANLAKFTCDMFETAGTIAGVFATSPGTVPPFNYKALVVNLILDSASLAAALTWTAIVLLDD